MTIRIGAVSYLNTKPLIEGLAERLDVALHGGSLHLDLPSHLAEQLSDGQLDIALIPSVEFFRGPSIGRSYRTLVLLAEALCEVFNCFSIALPRTFERLLWMRVLEPARRYRRCCCLSDLEFGRI